MKKLLAAMIGCIAATAAQAQDWAGPYAGAYLGRFQAKSTWTTTQLADPAVCPPGCLASEDADLGARGGAYGIHVGHNWRLGRAAFAGVEALAGNVNARSIVERAPGFTEVSQTDRVETNYEWHISVLGRAGIAAGPVAFYAGAGPSWQRMSVRFVCPGTGDSWCNSPRVGTHTDIRFGFMAGAGAEWRVHRRWAARFDYRYARYQDKEHSYFSDTAEAVFARITLRTSLVSAGFSYRF